MKASRLLSILMLLQSRGRLTAGELASALEVSVRTILRDVDQLSAAGVPLWGERGRQGGFQLRPGWSTQLTGLTEPESHALLLAGLPGPATELGLGGAAASARLKMVASLPGPWREQAARVGERLHVDPVDWYRARETPPFLRETAEAVWHARRIEVDYESWRGMTKRGLEPLGLVLKAGTWYVVARTTGDEAVRTYRLAAIRALTTGAGTFRRPRRFDLAKAWQASASRFESELRKIEARVRVSPRGLKQLGNDRVPFVDDDDAPRRRLPMRRGWRELQLPIESLAHGARQLLGYGAEVEVVAPAALRSELLALARGTLARYEARPGADR